MKQFKNTVKFIYENCKPSKYIQIWERVRHIVQFALYIKSEHNSFNLNGIRYYVRYIRRGGGGSFNHEWRGEKDHLIIYFLAKKYGFWFVDLPRTSSTSIRTEMSENISIEFYKKLAPVGIAYHNERYFEQSRYLRYVDSSKILNYTYSSHISAKKVKSILGDALWSKTFTFSIVRNPWDRAFSSFRQYCYTRGDKTGITDPAIFVRYLTNTLDQTLKHEFYTCSSFITDENGKIIVDFIVRYENREKDLQYVGQKIGFPDLGRKYRLWKTSDEIHYSRFYNDEAREIVRNMYADDIRLFGYEFEEG